MTIRIVQRFETMGLEFTTFAKAVEYRENCIGAELDLCYPLRDCSPKVRLAVLNHLLVYREKIRALLDFDSKEPQGEDE